MKLKNMTNSGQSMFEVVMAIFIMSLIIVGVVILATNSITNSSFSRNKTLAGRYAQEAIEWLRSQRDSDITTFIAKVPIVSTPYTYCLNTLAWTNTGVCLSTEIITGSIFRRETVLTKSLISQKTVIEADVKVYWNDSKGYHEARSVTNFTDVRQK